MEQAEMDSLLLNVLLETQANDAALAVMERQLQTGQRQAGSDPQLRLLIALRATAGGRSGRGHRPPQPNTQQIPRRAFRHQATPAPF